MVAWYEPDTNGAEITSYKIQLKELDGDFSEDLVNCDGTQSSIVSSRTCFIPVSVFKTEPYNQPWGASIYAIVSATNIKGESENSDEGNGCIIIYQPDPPIELMEDTQFRSQSTLGIKWTAPVEDGGTRILDYQIQRAELGGEFADLASSSYTGLYVVSLDAGTIYRFRVRARNAYGYGDYSEEFQVLCAYIPEPPFDATTLIENNEVIVEWSEGVTNGSPITAYRIFVMSHNGGEFIEELVDCDGTLGTVVSNRICRIYLDTLTAEPYNLVLDESIYVQIYAQNVYGESEVSEAGNGATI